MTFNYNFYKEASGRWYVDIPSFPGPKAELEMVEGADTMLDIMSQGEGKINLSFSDKPLNGGVLLKKIEETPEIGGAYYMLSEYLGIEYNLKIWLCDVTKWVFGFLPNEIYFT